MGAMTGIFPRPHICFVDDAAHAAPVIAMGVRIDYGRDRKALANVLLEQLPRRARCLRGHQGVKDDPAGLAPDEGDVGEVKPADLIDARDHLVESVVVVENGLAEQRRMNTVELRPFHSGTEIAPCPKRHGQHPP